MHAPNPLPQLFADNNWQAVLSLSSLTSFSELPGHLPHFRTWVVEETPEAVAMPMPWCEYSPFERLLIVKAMRPDRLSAALRTFTEDALGRTCAPCEETRAPRVTLAETLLLAKYVREKRLNLFPCLVLTNMLP